MGATSGASPGGERGSEESLKGSWGDAQQFRTLAAFLDDPGLVPRTYTAAYNQL